MVFDGYGWNFRGPRFQEVQFQDLTYGMSSVDVPCGKCDLCRVDKRYSNALRIMLEAESWPDKTYFITLTFDDENLGSGVLDHSEWSQFMKNFRQEFCQAKYCDIRKRRDFYGKVRSVTFKKVKQVMCGEYGDSFGRKHFHGIIFNHRFDDLVHTGEFSKKGFPIYTSEKLSSVWKKGRVQVSEVTFDLALYVGSYVTDKSDGGPEGQYGRFGQGIGLSWIRKFWKDVVRSGNVQTKDGSYPVPRYFLKKIQDLFPVEFERFRSARDLRLSEQKANSISKGDGPLRRAHAKGRIHQRFKKRYQDEVERKA